MSSSQARSSAWPTAIWVIYVSTDRRSASRMIWPKRRDAKPVGRELFGFRKPGGPLFVMTTRTLGLLGDRAAAVTIAPETPCEFRLHGVWTPD
jgi:hypothetical protein